MVGGGDPLKRGWEAMLLWRVVLVQWFTYDKACGWYGWPGVALSWSTWSAVPHQVTDAWLNKGASLRRMNPVRACAVLLATTVFVLSGCTLHELSQPLASLRESAYPEGPRHVTENPASRNVFYGPMPKAVTLEWVFSGHEGEPRAAVESRLRQIEAVVKSQLQSKGYTVLGVLRSGASADELLVRVQVDYETSPTLEVGSRGWDHSVSVACVQGEDTLGSATCRWINHESDTVDGILQTLATKAAAHIPAAEKASAPTPVPASAPGA